MEKKLQIFFCLGAFTQEEQNFINKKAFFMLNFLNLKSFLSYLFCSSIQPQHTVRTQFRFGTGTGTRSGNSTITSFDILGHDLNMLGSVVERPYLSNSTHTRTNNCEIPTISRPVLEDFSLHRQRSLHRPRWDFESRVAERDRLPISLSIPFSEPSNSAVANAPSGPPIEWPLSLPSYEEAINQPNYEIEEEPPPTYDKIVLKINI